MTKHIDLVILTVIRAENTQNKERREQKSVKYVKPIQSDKTSEKCLKYPDFITHVRKCKSGNIYHTDCLGKQYKLSSHPV